LSAALFPAAVLFSAGGVFAVAGSDGAEAKTPGSTYCFYGKCHRVKSIAETEALIGTEETISASFYDSCDKDSYNPCGLTSSGEVYRPDAADNAASPIYPDGTTLLAWSPATGASVVLRVNNAGPYWGNRQLDVSRAAAQVLGFAGEGVGTLKIRVLNAPDQAEATYKANRHYDPVPGYIGRFVSLDQAQAGAAPAYQVAGLTPPPASLAALQRAKLDASGNAAVQVAALAADTAIEAKPVDKVAEIKPIRVAAAVDVEDGDGGANEPAHAASADAAPRHAKPVQTANAEPRARRSHRERSAARNSRSVRVAARAQREETRIRVASADVAEREPKGSKVVTLDGTNDMSVFSRHTYAGMERIVPEERVPSTPSRREAYPTLARYADRDRDDG
jgi:rare lipoprotein A